MVPERRLTVLQVLPALESGGVERGTLEVARHLVAHGHRSMVLSAGRRLTERLLREGSEHITWDIGRKHPATLFLIPKLRHLLVEAHVDILHLRSRMPAWIGYLAWRGMDPATRPRLVTTVHGLYSVNRYSAVMLRGERIIAVSETTRDYILHHYPGTDPARIRVIPRGVEAGAYPFGFRPAPEWLQAWRTAYPALAGQRLITLPGRITRLKGHADFIGLVAALRRRGLPVHGLIVGGAEARKAPYLRELEDMVARQDLCAHITFTGTRADLREIMSVSDIVLALSTQPESFGRTVLEALSLGVPVLGYGHGGVGEQMARHYPAGAVPLGDRDALAERAAQWLHDAAPARRPIDDSLGRMLDDTLAVYRELAGASRPAGGAR